MTAGIRIPPTCSLQTDNVSGPWIVWLPPLTAVAPGDPWREATTSADGHVLKSTSSIPVAEGDGFHCSDLITSNGAVDSTVLAVQKQGLATIGNWLKGSVPSKREAVRIGREY